MNGKVFIDTNVFVYAVDRDRPVKQRRASAVVDEHSKAGAIVLSSQVLQEFYVNVTRKLLRPLSEAEAEPATRDLAGLDVVDVDRGMVLSGIALARQHRLSFWDALIVTAAQARTCKRLLSEDLQHGRRFGSLTVENPFLAGDTR